MWIWVILNYSGFASKLEAEKIRERTLTGKKGEGKVGKIPHGGFARLYEYDYDNIGKKRVINETETYWAKKIYEWLVNEGLSTSAITTSLLKATQIASQLVPCSCQVLPLFVHGTPELGDYPGILPSSLHRRAALLDPPASDLY